MLCSYCTGISHRPVSATPPNAALSFFCLRRVSRRGPCAGKRVTQEERATNKAVSPTEDPAKTETLVWVTLWYLYVLIFVKVVSTLWGIFKAHPISIVFYLIYLSFASLILSILMRLRNMPYPHLGLGEGLMYGLFFLIIIGILFLVVILINWAIRVKQRRFYGWFLLLIALPPIVIMVIASF